VVSYSPQEPTLLLHEASEEEEVHARETGGRPAP
jgi:hypothetical protein